MCLIEFFVSFPTLGTGHYLWRAGEGKRWGGGGQGYFRVLRGGGLFSLLKTSFLGSARYLNYLCLCKGGNF